MSCDKIVTITHTENEKPVDVLKVHKDYKLSDILDADVSSSKSEPVFFSDLERNLVFCGIDEMPNGKKIEMANELQDAVDQYLQAYSEFSEKVFSIESNANKNLREFSRQVQEVATDDKKDDVFNPLFIQFKNHRGEATIRLKIAFPYQENKDSLKEVLNGLEFRNGQEVKPQPLDKGINVALTSTQDDQIVSD